MTLNYQRTETSTQAHTDMTPGSVHQEDMMILHVYALK